MKKIGDLMMEMGFNKNAPQSSKEAFLKHLIKTTTGVNYETQSDKKTNTKSEQLSFDFESATASQKPSEKVS